jgi:hypothetical protein
VTEPDVTVTALVSRAPQEVWVAVADPARVAAWSPETRGVATPGTGPLPVGAAFDGSNSNGIHRWTTRCVVVESTPGVAFAFAVSYLGMSVSRWRYVLTPEGTGTRVEEQWYDERGWPMRVIGTIGTGVRDRRTHNERTMRATLEALRTDLERT